MRQDVIGQAVLVGGSSRLAYEPHGGRRGELSEPWVEEGICRVVGVLRRDLEEGERA